MKTVTCIDLDKNTYEVLVDSLRWRPSVYAIIIQDGNILLSPQWEGYDLPGGGVDIGETVTKCVVREVKEETGMDINPLNIVHVDSSFFKHPNHKDDYMHSILIYYTAEIIGGKLSIDGFDSHEKEYARLAEWIPLSKIHEINFISSVDLLPIIQKAIQ